MAKHALVCCQPLANKDVADPRCHYYRSLQSTVGCRDFMVDMHIAATSYGHGDRANCCLSHRTTTIPIRKVLVRLAAARRGISKMAQTGWLSVKPGLNTL